jgi:peroxiredoxin
MIRNVFLVIVSIAFSVALHAQSKPQNSFIVTGKIDSSFKKVLYLYNWGGFIDSCIVTKGEFVFKRKLKEPGMVYIRASDIYLSSEPVFLENKPIHIDLKIEDNRTLVVKNIKGSYEHSLFEGWKKSLAVIKDKTSTDFQRMTNAIFSSLGTNRIQYIQYLKLDSSSNTHEAIFRYLADSVDLQQKKYAETVEGPEIKKLAEDFIINHPDNYVSPYLLTESNIRFSRKDLIRLYNTLSPRIRHSYLGIELKNKINLSIGSKAPDFILKDTSGHSFKFAQAQGKYVLLEFWASWCGPCRSQSVFLKQVYETHHKKGFEIISVSIDEDKQEWVNAIREDEASWIQLIDVNEKVKKLYKIKGVPHNFLIDPNGTIIAADLSGIDYRYWAEKIFPK